MIVDLNLKGWPVVVVGAGKEGVKRVESFLAEGCKITVYASTADPRIKAYAREERIRLNILSLVDARFLDAESPRIVVAATDNPGLNLDIIRKAGEIGALAYSSDDPVSSDFSHLAMIRVGGTVEVAVSTGGKSPIMAREIKQEIEPLLDGIITRDRILYAKLHGRIRRAVRDSISTSEGRKKFMRSITADMEIARLIKDNKLKAAQRRAMSILDNRR